MKKTVKIVLFIVVGLLFIWVEHSFGGSFSVFNRLYSNKKDDYAGQNLSFSVTDIKNINILIKSAELILTASDEITEIECTVINIDKQYFTSEKNGSTLIFKDKTPDRFFGFIKTNGKRKVNITLPGSFKPEKLTLKNGAGIILIKSVTAESFFFETGVGNFTILDTVAAKSIKIQGGVGKVTAYNSVFYNFYYKTGVGMLDFKGKLYGNTCIQGGVGHSNIVIDESIEKYSLDHIFTGIGMITVNGKKLKAGSLFSKNQQATHSIDIEGGIGTINLMFTQ